MHSVLVTGANGQLGRRLIAALPPGLRIEAVVRSERARQVLVRHVGDRPRLRITVIDPCDADSLAGVATGCDAAVHLIGTIRETRHNRYADSHQRPARAFARAAARCGVGHVVYLSILGADAASPCRCLRARADVETVLRASSVPATVIRVPMVLGERDRASRALARRAAARHVFLYRAGSLEQPVYAGDVIQAMQNALGGPTPAHRVFDLAGPEVVSRRTLVLRAAAVLGRRPTIHSLPLALGLCAAHVLAALRANPPVTPDMLRVLDHDDAIDPSPAAAALDLTLTPLDTMLARCLAPPTVQDTRL